LFAKYTHDKIRAQIMHDHQIHICNNDFTRRDFFFPARLRQDFFNHVHRIVSPENKRFPLTCCSACFTGMLPSTHSYGYAPPMNSRLTSTVGAVCDRAFLFTVVRTQCPRYSIATLTEKYSPNTAPHGGAGTVSPFVNRTIRSSAPARRNLRSRRPTKWWSTPPTPFGTSSSRICRTIAAAFRRMAISVASSAGTKTAGPSTFTISTDPACNDL